MKIYEPREDSFLLQEYVEKYTKPEYRVLDMGTGTGIQAITAAKKAKKVVAVDINEEAVKQGKLSAEIDKINNIKFLRSDLFEKVKGKFDLIIFNPPYLPEEKVEDKALFTGKRGTETTLRFLDHVFDYMKKGSRILLISSSIANQNKIAENIKKNLLQKKLIAKTHIFFEDILLYEIKKTEVTKKLPELKSPKIFARGRRGYIIKGMHKNKNVAVKVKKNTTEARNIINNEAKFLEILNKQDIGPKMVKHDENFIMYEFVEGEFIIDFFEKSQEKEIITVLHKVFNQLRKMDELGINKFEMHNPIKHIIIKNNDPVLIDFERCRYTENPKNITQFCDFLGRKNIKDILDNKGINVKRENLISLARKYKDKPNKINFENIKKELK